MLHLHKLKVVFMQVLLVYVATKQKLNTNERYTHTDLLYCDKDWYRNSPTSCSGYSKKHEVL